MSRGETLNATAYCKTKKFMTSNSKPTTGNVNERSVPPSWQHSVSYCSNNAGVTAAIRLRFFDSPNSQSRLGPHWLSLVYQVNLGKKRFENVEELQQFTRRLDCGRWREKCMRRCVYKNLSQGTVSLKNLSGGYVDKWRYTRMDKHVIFFQIKITMYLYFPNVPRT